MSEIQSGERSDVCRGLLCGYFGAEVGPYYKRVYDACASLYYGESDCETRIPYGSGVNFSLTEIWRKMGNTGEPTRKQLDRVYEALDAMRLIRITIVDALGPRNVYLLNLGFYGHGEECSIDGVIIHRPPPLAGCSEKIDLAMIDPHGDVFEALSRAERRKRRTRDDQRA